MIKLLKYSRLLSLSEVKLGEVSVNQAMSDASRFVEVVERRQGLKIACLEEVVWRNRWVSKEEVLEIADELKKSGCMENFKKLP